MTLPTTQLAISAVRNELGESTYNLGELCKSSNINMWSKRKPVRTSNLEVAESDVGKTTDGFWGLNIPSYTGNDSLLTTYEQPRGGTSEPYRLGDFRGYYHNALIPLVIPPAPDEIEKKEQTIAFITNAGSNDSLSFTDFDSDFRLGIMVYRPNGTLLGSASATNAGGAQVTINLSNLSYSTLTFKWCMVDYYKAWDGLPLSGAYEVPRETTSDNQYWEDVPLVAEQTNDPVTTFVNFHDPFANQIGITVETDVYTGPIYIRFYTEDLLSIEHTATFNVTSADTEFSFTTTDNWINPGDVYTARMWLGSSASGAFDAEDTFTTFGGGQ